MGADKAWTTDSEMSPNPAEDLRLFDTSYYAGDAWLCDNMTKLRVSNYYDTIVVDLEAMGLKIVDERSETQRIADQVAYWEDERQQKQNWLAWAEATALPKQEVIERARGELEVIEQRIAKIEAARP